MFLIRIPDSKGEVNQTLVRGAFAVPAPLSQDIQEAADTGLVLVNPAVVLGEQDPHRGEPGFGNLGQPIDPARRDTRECPQPGRRCGA